MFLSAALGDLVSEEIRGWLDLAPRAILRLASTQLESSQRETIYRDEWLPELVYVLRGAESRPITRLIRGTSFALGLLIAARRIARYRSPAPMRGIRSELASLRYGWLITTHPRIREQVRRRQPMSLAHVVDLVSDRLGAPSGTLLADWHFVEGLECAAEGHFCRRAAPGVPQDLSAFTPIPLLRLEDCDCSRGQRAARYRREQKARRWLWRPRRA
jgi:hypothetical protein